MLLGFSAKSQTITNLGTARGWIENLGGFKSDSAFILPIRSLTSTWAYNNPKFYNWGYLQVNPIDSLPYYLTPEGWERILTTNDTGHFGHGTVTSISAGTGITNTPNPIVTTGTVTVNNNVVPYWNDTVGGTGAYSVLVTQSDLNSHVPTLNQVLTAGNSSYSRNYAYFYEGASSGASIFVNQIEPDRITLTNPTLGYGGIELIQKQISPGVNTGAIIFEIGNTTGTSISPDGLVSGSYTQLLPSKSGTFAMLSDIPSTYTASITANYPVTVTGTSTVTVGLATQTVTGTYGSSSVIPVPTFNAWGICTSIATATISATSTGVQTVYGTSPIIVTGITTPTVSLTYSATPTANTVSSWDGNKNFSANNFISGYQTFTTSSGTTSLTATSPYFTLFTGSSSQTVVLPSTSTLVTGESFLIMSNCSAGTLSLTTTTSASVQNMAINTLVIATCINTSSNAASSWDITYSATNNNPTSITSNGSNTVTSSSGNFTVNISPTYSNTWTATQSIDGSGSVIATGVYLTNTTSATSSYNAPSPALELDGTGWQTSVGSYTTTTKLFGLNGAVSASTFTGFVIGGSVNGGTFTPQLSYQNTTLYLNPNSYTTTPTSVTGGLACGTVSNLSTYLTLQGSTGVPTNTLALNLTTGNTLSASSGTQVIAKVSSVFNQTSTAGATGLLVSMTGTFGSGTKRAISTNNGGSELFGVDLTTGNVVTNGNVVINTPGGKMSIATGSNGSQGSSTLSSGTVTVSTTAVTSSSFIWVQYQSGGTLSGASLTRGLRVSTQTAGTSFVIVAESAPGTTNTLDNSPVQWFIFN